MQATKREELKNLLKNNLEGVTTRVCAKCGEEKIASYNINLRPDIRRHQRSIEKENAPGYKHPEASIFEMVKMTYGKYRDMFVCRKCKAPSIMEEL